MTHRNHVRLIQKAIDRGGAWADLGSGDGAFTLALRDIAGLDTRIYSVDKDESRLKNQQQEFDRMFPGSNVHYLVQDFTTLLDVPPLDGILMANSLHFVKDQIPYLQNVKKYLKPQRKLVIVEYNSDEGNMWVPYPFSFETFKSMAQQAGFVNTALLNSVPSSFLDEIYAAVCYR